MPAELLKINNMSDTPRIDAHIVTRWTTHSADQVSADFARDLERENARLKKENEILKAANEVFYASTR